MPPKLRKIGSTRRRYKHGYKASKVAELKAAYKKSITQDSDNGDYNSKNEISDPNDPNLSIRSIEKNKIIYNCKKCPNKNFKFEKNYKEHLLMEHSTLPGSIGCKLCKVVCPDQETLNAHVAKVHDRSIFYCVHCGKEFVRQAHVLRHMAQKGCDGSGVASFPCEICSATFTRKDNLIVHLRHMHIRKQLFRCKHNKCDFASKNLTKLIRHWHGNHAEVPNRFECSHCGKSTMSRAAMAKHLEIHGEKKYACDVCGYSTYTIEVMRRHILTHVEEKPYKCKACGSSYIQRAQLDRHLEKHVSTQCDVCGKSFQCRARLMIHKKEHDGVTERVCPYKLCPMSQRKFKTEEMLINHVNVHLHENNKMWSCEVCKKEFSSEMNMRRHLNTHTLDRPRRCMYCVSARAYVRGQQLVRHVRKFHREVFYSHLAHVRNVLVTMRSDPKSERVTKSELESILNLLDAESERILQGYSGAGVLYGGMQDTSQNEPEVQEEEDEDDSPLMSEEVLAKSLGNLLQHLIDKDTLQYLGWPDEPIDNLLEKVITQCGAKPADRDMWSRVQRLRENAKHLFLYVVDDKNVARMLGTHTIDQIIKHILAQAADNDADATPDAEHDDDDDDDEEMDAKGSVAYDQTTEFEIEIPVT